MRHSIHTYGVLLAQFGQHFSCVFLIVVGAHGHRVSPTCGFWLVLYILLLNANIEPSSLHCGFDSIYRACPSMESDSIQ